MRKHLRGAVAAVFLVGAVGVCDGAETREDFYDPLFLGYETEPAMDCGGRTLASLQAGLSRCGARLLDIERRPFNAMFYEAPLALVLQVFHHEFFGHGSRGREFGLDPTYGVGVNKDVGPFAYTSLGKGPTSNEQNILLAAGGSEGSTVLARRLLVDLYDSDGMDGSKVPLMLLAKLDFSLYVLMTSNPSVSPSNFQADYEDGNDIAYYLVSRQAQRRNIPAGYIYNNNYTADTGDPYLRNNYDDAVAAAWWAMLDPACWAAAFPYFVRHLWEGAPRIRGPAISFGGGFGLTAGTRAAIGPQEITRSLDLYLRTPGPLLNIYARDLQGSDERTYGLGAGVFNLPLPGGLGLLSLCGDWWTVPDGPEALAEGSGHNLQAELDVQTAGTWGFAIKAGGKTRGFFSGTPAEAGAYFGGGVTWRF